MRPFVHVNCAMSADGKIAGPDRKQIRISSQEDRQRVRNLRKQYDAVLVGVGTVVSDDPHLTVKGLSYDENPIRIVLDPHGRTPDGSMVLNRDAPTIIVTDSECEKIWDNAEIVRCRGKLDLEYALGSLADIGIESILVEGGGDTISRFFKAGLVDRYTVFVGNIIIGGRNSPTPVDGDGWTSDGGLELELKEMEMLGEGVLLTYSPVR